LDVIIRKGATVFELPAGENQALLVGENPLLVWDTLPLAVVSDDSTSSAIASQGLDENLHSTTETEHWYRGLVMSGC